MHEKKAQVLQEHLGRTPDRLQKSEKQSLKKIQTLSQEKGERESTTSGSNSLSKA